MQSTRLGLSLLVIAALSACGGDAPPPAGEGIAPAGSSESSAPGPWDTLAALPPEAQPYGLDVYTEKCASCHADLGQGKGKNPPIKGLTSTAMQSKLLDYRAAKFKGKTDLSDAEIAAVAIYAGE